MLKRWMRRIAGALGLIMVAGAGNAASVPAPAPRPALWAVSDADTTVYLFGTILLLPKSYNWRTSRFDQAIAGSQQLVVETIIDEKNPMAILSLLSQLGMSDKLPPLAKRVPPADRPALAEAIKKSGIPPVAFDRMKTWAAAFLLLGNQFKDMGLQSGEGVEITLRNAFASQGKSVGQLETNAEQLGFFDTLPEKAQLALLEGAITHPEDMTREFRQMLAAWSRGDVSAIAKTFNHDLAESPELKEALIKRRNANWSHWIEHRMAQPGAIMIAVGAGHLAGRDSVIDLLQRDGYKVHRVQ